MFHMKSTGKAWRIGFSGCFGKFLPGCAAGLRQSGWPWIGKPLDFFIDC
jgi:hypothetical protein